MTTLETSKPAEIAVLTIPEHGALDAITVFWQNFGVSKGSVTIICWGAAWTCYFGGMGGNTIEEFFAGANTSYLVNKLGITQWLKTSKRHDTYLGRIIEAIKATLNSDSPMEEK